MEDNRDLPEINTELFGGDKWIILFLLIVIMTDPAIDVEVLLQSFQEAQEALEKENRPG